mmetsp:Transcript_71603/g.167666  ORF Transcript_71603/g.167666 Transcript_71603/m.167666 type:complete len:140 (-) Transcript_71603:72-491(-)
MPEAAGGYANTGGGAWPDCFDSERCAVACQSPAFGREERSHLWQPGMWRIAWAGIVLLPSHEVERPTFPCLAWRPNSPVAAIAILAPMMEGVASARWLSMAPEESRTEEFPMVTCLPSLPLYLFDFLLDFGLAAVPKMQ